MVDVDAGNPEMKVYDQDGRASLSSHGLNYYEKEK